MIIYFSCKICNVKCSFNRPQEVILCSSEPCRACEKLKLCKLLEKRRRDCDFSSLRLRPRSSFLAALLLTLRALSHFTMMQKKNKSLLACMHLMNLIKVNKMKDILSPCLPTPVQQFCLTWKQGNIMVLLIKYLTY